MKRPMKSEILPLLGFPCSSPSSFSPSSRTQSSLKSRSSVAKCWRLRLPCSGRTFSPPPAGRYWRSSSSYSLHLVTKTPLKSGAVLLLGLWLRGVTSFAEIVYLMMMETREESLSGSTIGMAMRSIMWMFVHSWVKSVTTRDFVGSKTSSRTMALAVSYSIITRSKALKRCRVRWSFKSEYSCSATRWKSAVSGSSPFLPHKHDAKFAMYRGCCCSTHTNCSKLGIRPSTSGSVFTLPWSFGAHIDIPRFRTLSDRTYSASISRCLWRRLYSPMSEPGTGLSQSPETSCMKPS
mmetsp:Transcript_366/g.997  ORF Transcript_366/g.997 Transcript_366/m.997 type:complete len:293 (-) Transcript_366:1135-2013(-)